MVHETNARTCTKIVDAFCLHSFRACGRQIPLVPPRVIGNGIVSHLAQTGRHLETSGVTRGGQVTHPWKVGGKSGRKGERRKKGKKREKEEERKKRGMEKWRGKGRKL